MPTQSDPSRKPPPPQQQHQKQQERDSNKIEIASTKSDISEISATQTIYTLATQMSTVTQAIEGLQNDLATTEKKIKKRSESSRITNSERKG